MADKGLKTGSKALNLKAAMLKTASVGKVSRQQMTGRNVFDVSSLIQAKGKGGNE